MVQCFCIVCFNNLKCHILYFCNYLLSLSDETLSKGFFFIFWEWSILFPSFGMFVNMFPQCCTYLWMECLLNWNNRTSCQTIMWVKSFRARSCRDSQTKDNQYHMVRRLESRLQPLISLTCLRAIVSHQSQCQTQCQTGNTSRPLC